LTRLPQAPPYGGVVFDCDSTLASIEGIEELASDAAPELHARIRELTALAMDGRLPLEDAYGARLEALRPNRAQVERIGDLYVERALPHGRELVAALHFLGKHVAIVSGGLLGPVRALGAHFGITRSHIHAVDVHFSEAGEYAGFDATSPLARAGGKLEVIGGLANRYAPLALVGDGATDLEAAPVCARFIGFGGVEARPAILRAADAVCLQADLAALVPLLCSPQEQARLAQHPEHAALVTAAQLLS